MLLKGFYWGFCFFFWGGGGGGGSRADVVLVFFSFFSKLCGHGNTKSVLVCFFFLFCRCQRVFQSIICIAFSEMIPDRNE